MIILPSKDQRRPDWGEGLDKDGPPRDGSAEHYCVNRTHDPSRPRRFLGPPNSPPVCIPCQKANWAAYEKAKAEGRPMGNRALPGASVTRGSESVTRLIVVPNRLLDI